MTDELKQIEIETARIRLERERLALEDEIKRRQRVEDVKEAAASTLHTIKDRGPTLAKRALMIGWYLFLAWVALIILLRIFGVISHF